MLVPACVGPNPTPAAQAHNLMTFAGVCSRQFWGLHLVNICVNLELMNGKIHRLRR